MKGEGRIIMRKRKNARCNKGFSLIELIVVMVIVGVLAAVAVPSYIGYVAKAKKGVLETNAYEFTELVRLYSIDFKKEDWHGDWGDDGTDTLNNFIEYDLEVVNSGTYENNVNMKNPYSGKMSVLEFNKTISSGDGYCPAIFMTDTEGYAYDGNGSTANIIGTVVAYFAKSGDTTDHIEIYYINKDGSKSDFLQIIE